jgi:hypothetical protein
MQIIAPTACAVMTNFVAGVQDPWWIQAPSGVEMVVPVAEDYVGV